MVFRVSWRVGRGKFDPRGGHRLVNRKKIITRTEKLRRKNSYRRGLQVTSKSSRIRLSYTRISRLWRSGPSCRRLGPRELQDDLLLNRKKVDDERDPQGARPKSS